MNDTILTTEAIKRLEVSAERPAAKSGNTHWFWHNAEADPEPKYQRESAPVERASAA